MSARQPPQRIAVKVVTRPGDWAPSARLHLFGAGTLNDTELVAETVRLQVLTSAGNRPGADVRRLQAELEMKRRRLT